MRQPRAKLFEVRADHQAVHPRGAIERGKTGIDAVSGQARRQDSGLRRKAGVNGLGGGAELRHEPARHAGRDRQGESRLALFEPQQARASCRRADRADRRGRVPSPVAMRGVQALADASHDLQPGDIGVEAVKARCLLLLGQGQDGRHQHRAGMGFRRIEIVVEIERVRGRAIDECRPGCGEANIGADHRARSSPPGPYGAEDLAGDGFRRSGDGDTDRVHEGVPSRAHRLCGPLSGCSCEPRTKSEERIGGVARVHQLTPQPPPRARSRPSRARPRRP